MLRAITGSTLVAILVSLTGPAAFACGHNDEVVQAPSSAPMTVVLNNPAPQSTPAPPPVEIKEEATQTAPAPAQ